MPQSLSRVHVRHLTDSAPAEATYLPRFHAAASLDQRVAWGIDSDGYKHLLHLAVGSKESEQAWTEFLRHMALAACASPPAYSEFEAMRAERRQAS
ncbi:MAG: transposase [Actinomycetota bacterium]|nr:transposase [Actinomycetota bacterium]